MADEIAVWREQAMQCRRLLTALTDQATIATLTAWVKELEAKVAEAERAHETPGSTGDRQAKIDRHGS